MTRLRMKPLVDLRGYLNHELTKMDKGVRVPFNIKAWGIGGASKHIFPKGGSVG